MAVTPDILRAYRHPRLAMRRQMSGGVREDRALAHVMLASVLIFAAQWPRLAREATLDPSVPMEARVGGALLGLVFLAPLFFYVLAGISHIVVRAFGGKGTFAGARAALFWALLVTSPLFLLHGLAAGFIGPGATTNGLGLTVLAIFLSIWLLSLAEAERRQRTLT